MRLYYTGAPKVGADQTSIDKSIGGFISGSPVPSDYTNNLFGDISQLTLDNNLKEVKLLALKNETGAIVNNVTVYYNYPVDCLVKIEVAFVTPGLDDCGRLAFETIANIRSTPLYATFSEANGVENAVNIGPINPGAYVGIWLRKTILQSARTPKTTQQLINEYTTPLPDEEEISFNISWV